MKKFNKIFRAKSSGQLLIVAALAIAILIASTTMYVYELTEEKQAPQDTAIGEVVLAIKTGLRNTVISALANASKGGEKTVLAKNLERLSSAYRRVYQYGICQISYKLLNSSEYESGIKLSWTNSGLGVSSAHVAFTLKIFGLTSNITVDDAVNVTTAIIIGGYYTVNGDGGTKRVSLTCHVLNEEKPAQAKNITIYYEEFGVWIPVSDLSFIEWGNGTYTLSFTVTNASETVHVSVHLTDARNIFVMANATCSQA
jgi:hypothetical protein